MTLESISGSNLHKINVDGQRLAPATSGSAVRQAADHAQANVIIP